MRIGIMGHAGSGKSTLAKNLATALGASLIPDYTLDALVDAVGKPSWKGIKDTRIRKTVRLQALQKKIAIESAAESFVSDKTVVDYLAYWLQNQAEFETKEQSQSVIDMVRAHVGTYTAIVCLPYRTDIEWAEDRSQDPFHNLKVVGLKRGLLDLLGVRAVDAPYTFGEDMQAWIAKWLVSGGSSVPVPVPVPEPEPAPAAQPAPAKRKRKGS